VHGAATLSFIRRDGATRVADLYQRAPLRVLFPAEGDLGLATGIVATTSGGLVGGDRLDITVDVGDGAGALVTAQAAEKIYRSPGADCDVRLALTAGAGAWLEWLPQETILFDGARLRRNNSVAIEQGGRVLAGEILVFGRRASGERLNSGFIHEAWQVRRHGRLVWTDALRLQGNLAVALALPACLAGAAAIATLVYVGDDAPAALAFARDDASAGDDLLFAATLVGGILVGRWLARDAMQLRIAFGRFWAMLRHRIAGLPAVLPRVWSV
jgi:urease accessory protein